MITKIQYSYIRVLEKKKRMELKQYLKKNNGWKLHKFGKRHKLWINRLRLLQVEQTQRNPHQNTSKLKIWKLKSKKKILKQPDRNDTLSLVEFK